MSFRPIYICIYSWAYICIYQLIIIVAAVPKFNNNPHNIIIITNQLIFEVPQKMLQLKCQQKFSMASTYSYTKQIQSTILQSIPGWIKSRCSSLKIIRSICNLVKINPLECCLLAWLLAKSKYDIQKISMDSRVKSRIVQEEFDQKVLVYVLMNAYYVKEYVCDQLQPQIDHDISKQIPNFKHLYTKKFNPEKSLKTLSLSDINKIFCEWTCKQNKRSKIDYNGLVDKILYLSKSYNVAAHDQNKEEKLGAPRKRRKVQLVQEDQDGKSDLQSGGDDKSQSMHQFQTNKPKYGAFKFTHSPQQPDFLGPSQQNMHSFKREQPLQMLQSKRTTRNMLQSINIYDYIPSQDNLFNSQLSSMSVNNLIGSQQSMRNQHSQQHQSASGSLMRRSKEKGSKGGMKLKRTDSFDQVN